MNIERTIAENAPMTHHRPCFLCIIWDSRMLPEAVLRGEGFQIA